MKVYCDENIESAIIEGLRRRGIRVISVRDSDDLGKSDEYHLKRASELESVILTHDVDFLKLAHQWNQEGKRHRGILYAHPLDLPLGECIRMVELVTQVLSEEEMENHIEFL
jgi:hypothetical protein